MSFAVIGWQQGVKVQFIFSSSSPQQTNCPTSDL